MTLFRFQPTALKGLALGEVFVPAPGPDATDRQHLDFAALAGLMALGSAGAGITVGDQWTLAAQAYLRTYPSDEVKP